jgi:hypothetical protein
LLEHFMHEVATWLRALDFHQAENAMLKTDLQKY